MPGFLPVCMQNVVHGCQPEMRGQEGPLSLSVLCDGSSNRKSIYCYFNEVFTMIHAFESLGRHIVLDVTAERFWRWTSLFSML
jgi:hypothetical protein